MRVMGELRAEERNALLEAMRQGDKTGALGETVWLASREWAEERHVERMAPAIEALAEAQQRERVLREALEFYADPDTYYGIGMAGDSPCGAFLDDLDDAHDPGFSKPGKRARAALASRRRATYEARGSQRSGR
jgi:hypothetical protein